MENSNSVSAKGLFDILLPTSPGSITPRFWSKQFPRQAAQHEILQAQQAEWNVLTGFYAHHFKWWLYLIINNTWNSCSMALMWMVNSSCQRQHPVALPGKRTHHCRTLLSFPQTSTSLPFSFISSCQRHHFFVLNQYSHHVLLLCLKMHNARFLKWRLSASTARALAFCFCSFSWWVSSLF